MREVPQGQGGKAGQQESTADPDTESKGQGGRGGGRKGAALCPESPCAAGLGRALGSRREAQCLPL